VTVAILLSPGIGSSTVDPSRPHRLLNFQLNPRLSFTGEVRRLFDQLAQLVDERA